MTLGFRGYSQSKELVEIPLKHLLKTSGMGGQGGFNHVLCARNTEQYVWPYMYELQLWIVDRLLKIF
jgi:hypothetical protein